MMFRQPSVLEFLCFCIAIGILFRLYVPLFLQDDNVDTSSIHAHLTTKEHNTGDELVHDLTSSYTSLPGILKSAKLLEQEITDQTDLPKLFDTNPLEWTPEGKVKVCVFSRTPRQDSLMKGQILSHFGTKKYAYSILRATDCQYRGTCENKQEALLHESCNPKLSPTIEHVERIRRFQHDRYDKILERAMEFWDLVFSTGDEYCQTGHIAGKVHFRSYYGKEVVRSEKKPRLPEYMPLGPREEFKRVPSNEVVLASERALYFNFVGSITSDTRLALKKSLPILGKRFSKEKVKIHIISKWNKKLLAKYGYILPDEFRSILMKSMFTLCPQGHNPEAFRIFEAIEAGSIPIVTRDSNYRKHNCTDSYFDLLHSGAPIIVLNDWSELENTIDYYIKSPTAVNTIQASLLRWYREYMERKSWGFESEMETRFLERVKVTSFNQFVAANPSALLKKGDTV